MRHPFSRRQPLTKVVIATTLLFCVAPSLNAEEFRPQCSSPWLPGEQMAIDQQCGIEGSGGAEAEQDAVKNNFCASGAPTVITFTRLRDLQSAVERDNTINFGDREDANAHGPTANRAPLKALGEGSLVHLRGYVVTARQEGAESVNCGKQFDHTANKNAFHDIHISLVETLDLARAKDECQVSL